MSMSEYVKKIDGLNEFSKRLEFCSGDEALRVLQWFPLFNNEISLAQNQRRDSYLVDFVSTYYQPDRMAFCIGAFNSSYIPNPKVPNQQRRFIIESSGLDNKQFNADILNRDLSMYSEIVRTLYTQFAGLGKPNSKFHQYCQSIHHHLQFLSHCYFEHKSGRAVMANAFLLTGLTPRFRELVIKVLCCFAKINIQNGSRMSRLRLSNDKFYANVLTMGQNFVDGDQPLYDNNAGLLKARIETSSQNRPVMVFHLPSNESPCMNHFYLPVYSPIGEIDGFLTIPQIFQYAMKEAGEFSDTRISYDQCLI